MMGFQRTRRPDEEPEWPTLGRCVPHEDHQGHMVGGCGCSVWLVTAANGDFLELDPEPLEFRLDLAGQVMRASGEHFASYVGGYRLDEPVWFSGDGGSAGEEDDPAYGDARWEWFVTQRPLSVASDGVPLYGEHYLTCPRLSVRCKVARLHSDGDRDVIARELEQALAERQHASVRASEASASQGESARRSAKDPAPGRSQLGLF